MHKGIFSRLAKQNIRNNKSTYIPYMITCIFCIAMIYMMEFLRDCPTLDQAVRQADEVRMIVFTGEIACCSIYIDIRTTVHQGCQRPQPTAHFL